MSDIEPIVLSEDQTCPAVAYQATSVCVPVTVTPFAKAGTTITKCCGEPVITPGFEVCPGTKSGTCVFTISQDLCVQVPVEFWATAVVGETYVSCIKATSEDICTSCIIPEPDLTESCN